MKRWVRWAACLYPAEWRLRYGAEFEVLLEDAPLKWRDVADVIRGAIEMRMNGWMTYGKMALLSGFAGTLVAAGIAFSIADQYVCTGAMLIEGPAAPTSDTLLRANQSVLSRDSLFILVREMDLYQKERQRMSVADIAENQFRKHVHVIPYGRFPDSQPFRIVFDYPDRNKAKAVVDQLITRYMAWFQMQSERKNSPFLLTVLEHPQTPEKPTSPLRMNMMIFGLIAGTLIGLLSLKLWRRTRAYAVITLRLPREAKQFVDRQIAGGTYPDIGQFFRELIRAEEERHK